jgi:hypothetical protein
MQYRIHQHGSLGSFLPAQLLTDVQVKELQVLGVFDLHRKAGRIVECPDPDAPLPEGKDRTVISQKPLQVEAKTDDPTAIYRETGKGVVAPPQESLELDEIDELQELLEGDDD